MFNYRTSILPEVKPSNNIAIKEYLFSLLFFDIYAIMNLSKSNKNKNKKMKKEFKNLRIYAVNSLLVMLLGIFLLPSFANSTVISEDSIVRLVNYERIKKGLEPLTTNEKLTSAAQKKAEDIFKNNFFGHTIADRTFSSWIKDEKYEYSYIGENLAIDFISSEGAINAWLDSPTHKQNLLNDRFKETGVAVLDGKFKDKNTILIVQIFGTPAASGKLAARTTPVPKNIARSKETILSVGFDDKKKALIEKSNHDQNIYQQENFLTSSNPENQDLKNMHGNIPGVMLIDNKAQKDYFLILSILISLSILVGLTFSRSLYGLISSGMKKINIGRTA
jgi:uncharacterized protein YkwD